MGKIRVKTLGDEEEEQQKKDILRKAQGKRERKEAQKTRLDEAEPRRTAKAPGMKGGERVVAVGPTEEELARLDEQALEEQQKSVAAPDSIVRDIFVQ